MVLISRFSLMEVLCLFLRASSSCREFQDRVMELVMIRLRNKIIRILKVQDFQITSRKVKMVPATVSSQEE